jgi:acyl carrier protein
MEEKIKKIVLDVYGIEVGRHTLISELVEDSLSKIEFLFELEKTLGLSIPQDDIIDIETFGELIEVLEK